MIFVIWGLSRYDKRNWKASLLPMKNGRPPTSRPPCPSRWCPSPWFHPWSIFRCLCHSWDMISLTECLSIQSQAEIRCLKYHGAGSEALTGFGLLTRLNNSIRVKRNGLFEVIYFSPDRFETHCRTFRISVEHQICNIPENCCERNPILNHVLGLKMNLKDNYPILES